MPRPSRNTDQLLITAARALLPETGCTGMKLRQVAKKAGVNLGMFSYHFKSKDEFIKRVLQDTYDEFFKGFTIEASDPDPFVALEKALFRLACFVRDNRKLIIRLAGDIVAGEKLAAEFAKNNVPRHAKVLFRLVKECQKKGKIKKVPIINVAGVIFGTIGVPNVVAEIMERVPVFGGILRRVSPILFGTKKDILSDQTIRDRVAFALECVKVNGGKA